MEKWAASQNKRKSTTIVITKPTIHMETKVSATVAAVAAAFEPQEKHEPTSLHDAVFDEKPSAAMEVKLDSSPIKMNESTLLDGSQP